MNNLKIYIPLILIVAVFISILLYIFTRDAQITSSIIDNNKRYKVVSVHYGPLVITQDLSVTFSDKQDLAFAAVSDDSYKKFELHQNVILYDQNKSVLPLGGKLSLVRKHDKGADIVITLPKETNTNLLSDKVSIITRETLASARLPISTLQKDDDGNHFIWALTPKLQALSAWLRPQAPRVRAGARRCLPAPQ
ncbi:MAG: hypothetical protein AAF549_08950 [Pseudomonadota bacterium]